MILYNGATGSLGRFLAGRLADRGLRGRALTARLEDRGGLRDELDRIAPDGSVVLVQLAARASVAACEADPAGAFATNVDAVAATVTEVGRWARSCSLPLRVVYVSTGHVYAAAEPGLRLTEAAPTGPRSVYARTKLAAESAVEAACGEAEASLVVARVFGLVAPTQPDWYVLPALIARVRRGDVQGIPGLASVRDYLDARDVCDVLLMLSTVPPDALVDLGRPSIVNVCSGEPTSIGDLLTLVARAARPIDAETLLERASAGPSRADDIPWIVGDPARLESIIGRPARTIPLSRTVEEAVVG